MSAPSFATVPDAIPVVELGIGQTYGPDLQAGRWDLSHWDTPADAHWSGTEPLWVDVTCFVQSVDCTVGHDRTLDAWDVATATITVDNSNGWADIILDPLDPAELSLRPGRPIRWGVRYDKAGVTKTVWRFRGFVDSMRAAYAGQHADSDVAIFECVDALGEVARVHLGKLAAPVGGGETVSARLHRILDAVGWRPEWRDIDASSVPVFATDYDAQASDLLTATADSAGGALFGDYNGRVAFRGRDWQTWVPGTPPDLVIGNTVDAVVCPSSIEVGFPRAGTTTRALVNYEGNDAPPVQVDDTAAQLLYGVETTPERLDLQTSDGTQLLVLAQRLIETRGSTTMPRVNSLTLDAGRDRATWLAMLEADPQAPTRWHLIVERGGRPLLDRMLLVTSVEHSWDAHGWQASVRLDDAMPWAAAGGRWDHATWDHAEWADLSLARLLEATA